MFQIATTIFNFRNAYKQVNDFLRLKSLLRTSRLRIIIARVLDDFERRHNDFINYGSSLQIKYNIYRWKMN